MVTLAELTAEEQRVLGSLLEKEVTVPASYPMTLSSVVTACNQSSSREPVVTYDEPTVRETLRALVDRELVGVVWQDSGRRTRKYVQSLAVRSGWADDARALLTVLLLRGPQAPGALKTRTERLYPFADRDAVEACLAQLAAADPPLVAQLPRQAREQDNRWVHLLGASTAGVSATSAAPPAAPDRESVLGAGSQARDEKVRATYGAVADAYASALASELTDGQLPFETWLLDRVAQLAGGAPVVEVGCGPGHVTAYLAARGVDATGIDLTPEMIAQARARFPEGTYQVGDFRQLMRPPSASGWSAVLGWYSLIHLAPSELADAVAALERPLAAGGWLVLAMHAGSAVRHHDSWFDATIDVDLVMHDRAEVVAVVEGAGLVDVEWYLRGPVTSRGETTERLYVIARKPD